MKKLTAFILTIVLLLSSTVSSALSEGRDFLTFISTYYWALGQRFDDIPHTSTCFVCNLPEDENYAFYAITGGQIMIDSRTDEIVKFIPPRPLDTYYEVFILSLILSLEYEFADLRVSGSQEEFLANKWNSVSDILNKVCTEGSYESERYIYEMDSSERFHVIEKDYAATQQ